jgi:hypothetical protein
MSSNDRQTRSATRAVAAPANQTVEREQKSQHSDAYSKEAKKSAKKDQKKAEAQRKLEAAVKSRRHVKGGSSRHGAHGGN